MKVYLTPTKMTELFGAQEMLELSQLYDPDATTPDDARIQANIDSAEAEINSYLTVRYELPFASVPLVLSEKAADIARYKLDSVRARDDVRLRYEDALRWLRLVCDGKINLGIDEGGEEVEADTAIAGKTGLRSQAFTDANLSGYC